MIKTHSHLHSHCLTLSQDCKEVDQRECLFPLLPPELSAADDDEQQKMIPLGWAQQAQVLQYLYCQLHHWTAVFHRRAIDQHYEQSFHHFILQWVPTSGLHKFHCTCTPLRPGSVQGNLSNLKQHGKKWLIIYFNLHQLGQELCCGAVICTIPYFLRDCFLDIFINMVLHLVPLGLQLVIFSLICREKLGGLSFPYALKQASSVPGT